MSDRSILLELYTRYHSQILVKCRRLLNDPDQARDAAQEVFLRAYDNLDKFRYGESALPWLYCIANNHCLNLLKKHNTRRRLMQEKMPRIGPQHTPDFGKLVENQELLRELLRRCDPQTAEIAMAHYIDEMTVTAVAETMGLSRKTVRTKLDRFLLTMRKVMARL